MQRDSTRDFLIDIGRHKLLNPDEELELGRQIQLMLNPPEDVSSEELLRIKREGKRAKNRMIVSNLRLVVAVAKKYKNRGLELLDLVQEGSIGLERAAEKFDPEKGWKFSTYAYWWIRQGIIRALAQDSRTIRLPVHVSEKLNKIKSARRELSQLLGRAPTIEEISRHSGLELEVVRQAIKHHIQANSVSSLDQTFGDKDEPKNLLSFLPSPDPTPWDSVEHLERQSQIESLMSAANLNERERQALRLRYGLVDGTVHTLAAAGKEMGVSRDRLRQLEFKSLQKIRAVANLSGRVHNCGLAKSSYQPSHGS